MNLNRFGRFLVAGGLNTAVTYVLYLALIGTLGYAVSYSLAFLVGIVVSYLLNRRWVFRSSRGAVSTVLYPTIYLAQYAIGLVCVVLWVDVFRLPAILAPAVAIAASIPVTYVLAGTIFGANRVRVGR